MAGPNPSCEIKINLRLYIYKLIVKFYPKTVSFRSFWYFRSFFNECNNKWNLLYIKQKQRNILLKSQIQKTISKRHWLQSTTSFKHLKRATKCMSYTYIHFFAAQINYCIHLRTRWNRKLQKVQVMTATRFWMLIQLASLSCIYTYQGRRKVWKSRRGGQQ